jgi:hypothetical protein
MAVPRIAFTLFSSLTRHDFENRLGVLDHLAEIAQIETDAAIRARHEIARPRSRRACRRACPGALRAEL